MISIRTLGEFDIMVDDESILQAIGYSYKIMRLFKYFLTFQGQKRLPEKIVEDFRMDEEFMQPKNVLRTQISRARNMMDWEEKGIESFFRIQSVNGYYVMYLNRDCRVDYTDFERSINNGRAILEDAPDQGLKKLREGLDLYMGEYLPETGEEDWLIPIRSRYDRLYLKGITAYFGVLSKMGRYNEIVEMSEKAVQIKPYEEVINLYFIEALMKTGERRYANTHYQYYSSKLYNDLGVKPTDQMRELYKKLQTYEDSAPGVINLGVLVKELGNNSEDRGVTICDVDYFKFLYNLEVRNKDRNQKDIFIGLATLDSKGNISLSDEEVNQGMNTLLNVVHNNLRKGDVVTKWNDGQLALMLYSLNEEDLDIISQRLTRKFHEEIGDDRTTINIKYTPLQ